MSKPLGLHKFISLTPGEILIHRAVGVNGVDSVPNALPLGKVQLEMGGSVLPVKHCSEKQLLMLR